MRPSVFKVTWRQYEYGAVMEWYWALAAQCVQVPRCYAMVLSTCSTMCPSVTLLCSGTEHLQHSVSKCHIVMQWYWALAAQCVQVPHCYAVVLSTCTTVCPSVTLLCNGTEHLQHSVSKCHIVMQWYWALAAQCVQVSHCSVYVRLALARAQTRPLAVTSEKLIAWSMARHIAFMCCWSYSMKRSACRPGFIVSAVWSECVLSSWWLPEVPGAAD
jgi:hypothetical protein